MYQNMPTMFAAHLADRAGQACGLGARQQRIHSAAAVALDDVKRKPAEEELEHTQLRHGRGGAAGRQVGGCCAGKQAARLAMKRSDAPWLPAPKLVGSSRRAAGGVHMHPQQQQAHLDVAAARGVSHDRAALVLRPALQLGSPRRRGQQHLGMDTGTKVVWGQGWTGMT